MSGHPLHGIKPQAAKIRVRMDTSIEGHVLYLWKLQRKRGAVTETHRVGEILATLLASADRDAKGHLVSSPAVRAWEARHPGWKAVLV